MKKYKKVIIISIGILAAFLAVLFFTAGMIIEKTVQTAVSSIGPKLTGAEMKIGGVRLNVFNGRLVLLNIHLGNPQGLGYQTSEALNVGRVTVEIDPHSLFSDKIIIKEITIRDVDLTMEVKLTSTNISDIQKNINKFTDSPEKSAPGKTAEPEKTADPTKKSERKKLQVDLIDIDGVTVNVSAVGLGGEKASIPIPQIKIENMGKSGSGITIPELIGNILTAIIEGSINGVAGKMPEIKLPDLKSILSEDRLKETGDRIADGIKNLFK